jgi:hypothetical protein
MKATIRVLAMGGLFFCLTSSFIFKRHFNKPVHYRAFCLSHGATTLGLDFLSLGPERYANEKQASKDWKRHSAYYGCSNGGVINNASNSALYYYKLPSVMPYPFTVCLYY